MHRTKQRTPAKGQLTFALQASLLLEKHGKLQTRRSHCQGLCARLSHPCGGFHGLSRDWATGPRSSTKAGLVSLGRYLSSTACNVRTF